MCAGADCGYPEEPPHPGQVEVHAPNMQRISVQYGSAAGSSEMDSGDELNVGDEVTTRGKSTARGGASLGGRNGWRARRERLADADDENCCMLDAKAELSSAFEAEAWSAEENLDDPDDMRMRGGLGVAAGELLGESFSSMGTKSPFADASNKGPGRAALDDDDG
jgi:hypothetical protein